jgi:hypothetical protein
MAHVGRPQAGLDHQTVAARHDFHNRLARPDDAADGVEAQILDDAVDRTVYLGAEFLIGRFGEQLLVTPNLELGLAELARRLAAKALLFLLLALGRFEEGLMRLFPVDLELREPPTSSAAPPVNSARPPSAPRFGTKTISKAPIRRVRPSSTPSA